MPSETTVSITPDTLLLQACYLDEAARRLRLCAASYRDFAYRGFDVVTGTYFHYAPTVLHAAELSLCQAAHPMHLRELFTAIRETGAQLDNKANLSSMLSRDRGKTFRRVPGRYGFWELTSTIGTFNTEAE